MIVMFLMDLVDFSVICVVAVLMKYIEKMCSFSVDDGYVYDMRMFKMQKS